MAYSEAEIRRFLGLTRFPGLTLEPGEVGLWKSFWGGTFLTF
jgi:hypothetical protein